MKRSIIQEVVRFFSPSCAVDAELLEKYRRDPVRYFFARKLILTAQYNERKSMYLERKIVRTTKLLRHEHLKLEKHKKLCNMARYNTQFVDIISELFENIDADAFRQEKLAALRNRAYHLINQSRIEHFSRRTVNEN